MNMSQIDVKQNKNAKSKRKKSSWKTKICQADISRKDKNLSIGGIEERVTRETCEEW